MPPHSTSLSLQVVNNNTLPCLINWNIYFYPIISPFVNKVGGDDIRGRTQTWHYTDDSAVLSGLVCLSLFPIVIDFLWFSWSYSVKLSRTSDVLDSVLWLRRRSGRDSTADADLSTNAIMSSMRQLSLIVGGANVMHRSSKYSGLAMDVDCGIVGT